MVQVWRFAVVSVALLAMDGLSAQTIYKSVDEKGNVIYSETPPAAGKDGKIRSTKELNIDPNRNVLPAQQPVMPRPVAPAATSEVGGDGSGQEPMADAQGALEAAEAALKAGAEVQPGDFMGRADGSVGPSPQRLQRLEDLQRAVDEARQNLQRLQGD